MLRCPLLIVSLIITVTAVGEEIPYNASHCESPSLLSMTVSSIIWIHICLRIQRYWKKWAAGFEPVILWCFAMPFCLSLLRWCIKTSCYKLILGCMKDTIWMVLPITTTTWMIRAGKACFLSLWKMHMPCLAAKRQNISWWNYQVETAKEVTSLAWEPFTNLVITCCLTQIMVTATLLLIFGTWWKIDKLSGEKLCIRSLLDKIPKMHFSPQASILLFSSASVPSPPILSHVWVITWQRNALCSMVGGVLIIGNQQLTPIFGRFLRNRAVLLVPMRWLHSGS